MRAAQKFSDADARLLAILLALGLVTRFALLNYPRAVVFDEYHFGKFVNGYLSGEYFFDIHPPLGKLVLALAAYAGGYNGTQGWQNLGDPIPLRDNIYALRAGPALQGALLPPLLFIAGRALGLSQPAALLAPAGVLFDVCTLVEQRLVLTDATLLLGIGLQLAASFSSDHYTPLSCAWTMRVGAAGCGIAIAVCTKWTGAACLAFGGAHSLLALHRGFTGGARASRLSLEALARLGLLILLPAVCYVLCGLIHFALLPLTGPGASFMSAAFRATLIGENAKSLAAAKFGNPNPSPLSLFDRFIELNREMLRANAGIRTGHEWASKWYQWPLMGRSVLYWIGKLPPYTDPPDRPVARIYAIGTPAVWWLAAAAPTLFFCWATARVLAFANPPPPKPAPDASADPTEPSPSADGETAAAAEEAQPAASTHTARVYAQPNERVLLSRGVLLLLGYVANWLPFSYVERAAFIYHFLPALIHALLLAGVLLDAAVPPTPLLHGRTPSDPRLLEAMGDNPAAPIGDGMAVPDGWRWLAAGALIYMMVACFAFFSPLAYCVAMSDADFDARMWLNSWR